MPQTIAIVGMPSCMGGNRYGCEQGPRALRHALFPLLDKKSIPFEDYGNVTEPCVCGLKSSKAKCLAEIASLHNQATKFFQDNEIFKKSHFPILLGGDHSVNYPFIREAARHKKIGLIWFDAHGDFNTPDISPSGNIHGMVLAALAGHGLTHSFGDDKAIIDEANICIVGTRDVDPDESKLLKKTNVHVFSMKEIKKRGLKAVLEDAIVAAGQGTKGIHLSFDMDVFDPSIAPHVSTPVPGGLLKKDIKTIAHCFKNQNLTSLDAVEINPSKNMDENETAELAAKLLLALIEK